MMKALEALVKADTTKTSGNHAVEYLNDVETVCFVSGCKIGPWQNRYDVDLRVCNGYTRKFTYHGNTICLVDDNTRKMILTHAGWYTRSTSRALNDYRRYFLIRGYQIVEEH